MCAAILGVVASLSMSAGELMPKLPWNLALERYSERNPREVLRIQLEQEDGSDTVIIYRGFSSSLVRGTPADVSEPVIPHQARLITVERIQAPLDPVHPRILATYSDLTAVMELLQGAGIEITNF